MIKATLVEILLVIYCVNFIWVYGTICPLQCPNGWSLYGNNCYNLFTTQLKQDEAQAYCALQADGSYLAEIISYDELIWVSNISSGSSFWVIFLSYFFTKNESE